MCGKGFVDAFRVTYDGDKACFVLRLRLKGCKIRCVKKNYQDTEAAMAAKDESRKKIIEALNLDRAYELGAILQYMGHHYEAEGMESPAIIDIFKKTALDEMKHAELLGERIVYLGGVPVQKATPAKRGGELKAMVVEDLASENDAIERYKKHIKLCDELGDPTTRLMLEGILSDEEGHADTWETTLGIRK